MEMDDLQRGVTVEVGHLHNPVLVKFKNLFVVYCAHPKIHLSVVFLYLYADSVELGIHILLCTYET